MATTNLNLPAISGSSQQGGFPATFNDAMGKIDTAYGDLSKKTAIPVTLNDSNVSSGTITVTRNGRVVNVRIGVTVSGSGTLQVGSFSASHAPGASVYFLMLTGGVTASEHNGKIGYINTSGQINIYQCTDGSYIRGECTYIV